MMTASVLKRLAPTGRPQGTVVGRFTGAKLEIIRRHLGILSVMGEVQQNPDGRYQGSESLGTP